MTSTDASQSVLININTIINYKCVKQHKCPANVKTDTMKYQLFSIKNSPIRIASAHIHIPRNNPAKFHDNPMDSLGGVVDKEPLYYVYVKWF